MEVATVTDDKQKFNKKEYNKNYLLKNKEKYNEMSRNRNYDRYYTDDEYRAKIIERAKLSVYKKRMELKNMA